MCSILLLKPVFDRSSVALGHSAGCDYLECTFSTGVSSPSPFPFQDRVWERDELTNPISVQAHGDKVLTLQDQMVPVFGGSDYIEASGKVLVRTMS